ncbi:MAG: helix-turn-helix domain-containing protein [Sphaerochaetaceae bacterium]|jgi:transcriptional regulator with XRE-family HTH domain
MRRKAYGRTIRLLRRSRRLTQEQLEERTGIGRSQIYYLESGKRLPRLETLEKLCLALDCSMARFMMIAEQIAERMSDPDDRVCGRNYNAPSSFSSSSLTDRPPR